MVKPRLKKKPKRAVRQCIVPLCPNRSNEGRFYGPICAPCAEGPVELQLLDADGLVLVSGTVRNRRYSEVVERTGKVARWQVVLRAGPVGLLDSSALVRLPTTTLCAGSNTVELSFRKRR
jgi:hypothetical protein